MRKSNFELLRIVCMFFILGVHIVTQTSMNNIGPESGIVYYYIVFLESAGRLVCNTFVMIGAWFLVDSDFKAMRVLNLWLEIFLYSVGITILCSVVGPKTVTITQLIQSFFPIFGRPVWFGAEYICLLMLTPWLNLMLKEEHIKKTKKLIVLIGSLIIGCATIFPIEHTTPAFSELVWFSFLYLLTGLYKQQKIQINKVIERYSVIWLCVCYLGICAIKIVADYTEVSWMKSLYIYYRTHYEALPGLVCSILLFITFKNMKLNYNKGINVVSRSLFAVYVIHQMPAFYGYMWNGIFRVDQEVNNGNVIGYSLMVIMAIIFMCVIIDQVRMALFNKYIYESKIYRYVCKKLDSFYSW